MGHVLHFGLASLKLTNLLQDKTNFLFQSYPGWAPTKINSYFSNITIGWKELFETNMTTSWMDKDKSFDNQDKTPYDIIFVPSFKNSDNPYKYMAFASPVEHPHAEKYDLPKNWTMRSTLEYNYGEKLPHYVKLSSLYKESSSFEISMNMRLTYEGEIYVFF